MIRVYIASKLHEAPMWRAICAAAPHVIFHARWLKHQAIGTPNNEHECRAAWVEDEEDIRSSDALIVFAREGDHLRGALVEVGMAIAHRVPIYAVGNHPDYGTWQYHPAVTVVPTIDVALERLKSL